MHAQHHSPATENKKILVENKTSNNKNSNVPWMCSIFLFFCVWVEKNKIFIHPNNKFHVPFIITILWLKRISSLNQLIYYRLCVKSASSSPLICQQLLLIPYYSWINGYLKTIFRLRNLHTKYVNNIELRRYGAR